MLAMDRLLRVFCPRSLMRALLLIPRSSLLSPLRYLMISDVPCLTTIGGGTMRGLDASSSTSIFLHAPSVEGRYAIVLCLRSSSRRLRQRPPIAAGSAVSRLWSRSRTSSQARLATSDGMPVMTLWAALISFSADMEQICSGRWHMRLCATLRVMSFFRDRMESGSQEMRLWERSRYVRACSSPTASGTVAMSFFSRLRLVRQGRRHRLSGRCARQLLARLMLTATRICEKTSGRFRVWLPSRLSALRWRPLVLRKSETSGGGWSGHRL
mmetsp:Transcript_18125/g.43388  ORF Transcript_18125/g.43388 Transcript_18125/m.43388 type:complete len:269 (-) Transcript_18125:1031-1837(-)